MKIVITGINSILIYIKNNIFSTIIIFHNIVIFLLNFLSNKCILGEHKTSFKNGK